VILTGETEIRGEKPLLVPIHQQEIPTRTVLGSNPCFHVKKPARWTVLLIIIIIIIIIIIYYN